MLKITGRIFRKNKNENEKEEGRRRKKEEEERKRSEMKKGIRFTYENVKLPLATGKSTCSCIFFRLKNFSFIVATC